jgi:3'-phosphoadenosine 5'-phosphosulfate sulfotransferase (PAPS reductase)/FAD synthetase
MTTLLEAESIHIMREVVAECRQPGDALFDRQGFAVMLHLAMKAFYPASRRSRCCTSTRRGSSAR